MARRTSPLLSLLLLAAVLVGGGLFAFLEVTGGRAELAAELEATPPAAESDLGRPVEEGTLAPPRVVQGEGGAPGSTTVLWPLEVELMLVEPAYVPKEPGLTPIGSGATARLEGQILSGALDAEGALAEVRFVAGANEGRVLRTDADGRFGASDLYPGLSVVAISGPGLIGARREVRLRQGKETSLKVPFGRPGALQGRVQDREGSGIQGADVVVDGHRSVTGPEGDFYVGPVAPGEVLVEVSHPDYARYQELVWVASDRVAPSGTVSFTLEPAAQLKVAVQGDVGGPGPVQLYLLPGQPTRRVHSESVYHNVRYPYHLRNPIEVWPGVPEVIDGLPAEVVQVHAFRPGAQSAVKHANLRSDYTFELELRMKAAPLLTGRVTRDGEPAADAEVVLEAPNRVRALLAYLREGAHYLETTVLPDLPPARQVVRADDRGRFSFTAYEEFSSTRYLEAHGADGRGWAGQLVHAGDSEIDLELTDAERAESELRLDFAGRHQGLPFEVWIDGAPGAAAILPPDQELVLGPLLAGKWHLVLTWRGEPVAEETLTISGVWDESFTLPSGAIHGQDEETWRRAGREFPH